MPVFLYLAIYVFVVFLAVFIYCALFIGGKDD